VSLSAAVTTGRNWLRSAEGRSAAFYVIASLLAGVFNYLFQVVASRQLSAENFAAFNGWFANISILFMFGGVLQGVGVFVQTSERLLRSGLILINMLMAAGFWIWLAGPVGLNDLRAGIILLISILFGWLTGQVQARLWFGLLSLAGLGMAVTKFLTLFLPIGSPADLERYAFAMFVPYLFLLILFTSKIWGALDRGSAGVLSSREGAPDWLSPVLLAVALAVIPQLDMVVMSHTQPGPAFAEFVRASLFYRAIYVLALIFAQWLLPRQVKFKSLRVWKSFPLLFGLSLALSSVLAFLSPWIVEWVFHWDSSPGFWIIWLSCVHTACLALLLFYIQEALASRDYMGVIVIFIAWAVEAGIQFGGRFPVWEYLTFMIFAQLSLSLVLYKRGQLSGE
jgi:hypothetical protein